MRTDIHDQVKFCDRCQFRKPPRPTRHRAPGHVQANAPMEMVSIDVVGPLCESSGFVKLLTAVDVFTGYCWAIPIENETMETVFLIDDFEETKLLNFFSIAGINFKNIASNDAIISSKINTMTSNGWDLAFVVSGVESDAGKDDGQGIYITRYIFKRLGE